MSSIQYLREFVTERLTAAAEEILGFFEKTIVEYEEEIDRQRRLLDIVWKPEIKLQRIEHAIMEEDVPTDQQLGNQERNSSSDQEDPELPQIKEEQEELCSSQDVKELVLKQETENFMLIPTNEENDHSEPEPSIDQQLLLEKKIVQYEEEIDRQRRLLDIVLKPEIKLHTIELPKQRVCKEKEVLTDQQLCNQETRSSVDQVDPEPSQIIKEGEELCSSQRGEDLLLKQETDTFMLIPTNEESDHQVLSDSFPITNSQDTERRKHVDSGSTKKAEPEPKKICHIITSDNNNTDNTFMSGTHCDSQTELPRQHVCKEEEVLTDQQLQNQERNSNLDQEDPETSEIKEEQEELCISQRVEELVPKNETENFMLIPPYDESDHQPLSESQQVDSESTRTLELKPNREHTNTSYNKNVDNSLMSETHCDTHTGKRSFTCGTCGKMFKYKSAFDIHLRIHTGEKPYVCNTCGKRFTRVSALNVHLRIHTGERPYFCRICRNTFTFRSGLLAHIRTHSYKFLNCNEATMSSVRYLKEFVTERLTAAAEEIFGVFEKTIGEYQEELVRQRKLLDIIWKPEIQLPRIELPQLYVCKKVEGLNDQQPCDQKENCGLDQEHPQPSQMKEEKEELCSNQEGEEIVLKQETEISMLVPTDEESDHSEAEPKRDHQLLSDSSSVAESQDQEGSQHVDLPSTINAEPKVKRRRCNNKSHTKNADNSHTELPQQAESQNQKGRKRVKSKSTKNKEPKPKKRDQENRSQSEESFKCETCGKSFQYKCRYTAHLRSHTGEKPFVCNTCGKRFHYTSHLNSHLKIHTGEKPYPCKTCGKRFVHASALKKHMRSHTGEKPYACETCGKRFSQLSSLRNHMVTHSDDKPYPCNTCGKRFNLRSVLKIHMRIHTELPEQHICKEEEVLTDKQLCNQESNSSLDRGDPDPPQIKQEQEELCTSQDVEELVLKQETDTFTLTPTYEESDDSEPEQNSDNELLSHNFPVVQRQDLKGIEHVGMNVGMLGC
ncbi:hypothetical protein Q8A73_015586 [Channa argus]|nr:hypothetical protein Q8A73_015586 [Channa argus]